MAESECVSTPEVPGVSVFFLGAELDKSLTVNCNYTPRIEQGTCLKWPALVNTEPPYQVH